MRTEQKTLYLSCPTQSSVLATQSFFSISTLASLKHAPPPTTLMSAGQRAVGVKPLRDDFLQAPLGKETTPSRARVFTWARQITSPSSLNTRTVSPFTIYRTAASAG